jgi:hypothetical protein
MTNDYHFITHWRLEATAEEVFDLISEPAGYGGWWPSVYLEVEELEAGQENGLGRRFRFHTKGWLPYTLDWASCAMELRPPNRLAIRATGDCHGRGIWTISQKGTFTEVEFDWKLTAEKPLLRYLAFLLKPVFSANHRWAMRRGLEGLETELQLRHGSTQVSARSYDR